MLIRHAEVDGAGPLDVRLEHGIVAELGPDLDQRGGEATLDAGGGALLPGLHDHHIHLHALAAAQTSIECGPPAIRDAEGLARALRSAARTGRGWLRGVGYHESVAGALDRDRLDAIVGDRPLRVQHRSGSAWLLNSAALAALALGDTPSHDDPAPGSLERDARGRATGRLFRGDAWLRQRLAGDSPDLASTGRALARVGITSVTDATADNDDATLRRFREAALPQRVCAMGSPDLAPAEGERVSRGAVKALLDEPRLPEFAAFCARIRDAHARERGFAVHCVTRVELVFALAAFAEVGTRAGDRLEHAAIAPPELVREVARLGLLVVTQPHFVAERGDAYREDVASEDLPWLYRLSAWREAGVALAGGSDAPFGTPDPWRSMAAAVQRRTPSGAVLGASEALSPEHALALFTTPADAPGSAPRRIAVGAPGDLCLLDRPWRDARARLAASDVAATFCAGRLVWTRDG